MTFDLEKYEDAIMSQDDSRRIQAGLELAKTVVHLEPEILERFSQPIVDLLLESLRKTDWEFRNLISNALLVLGRRDVIAKSTWFWKKLISTYTEVDAGLRSSAMDLLKELGRSEYSLEILEPLIEGLRSPDKDMRILSANTLGQIRAREVIPMLIQSLQDENANVVYSVVECLGDIGDPRGVPALMRLLTDHDDEWVHVATLEALGKIGDQRVVELLLSLVKKESVIDPLISALGVLGDSRAFPVLANYLRDEDRDIRELAIKAFVNIWEEAEAVAHCSGVSYELAATRALLQQYLTTHGKNMLLQDMQDDGMPDDIRENCAVLLSCVGYEKALKPIVKLLERYPLSQKIIYALGQYQKRAFPHLRAYLDHRDFRIRQSVGVYMQNLVTQGGGYDSQLETALLQLANDENPMLNQLAFETLKTFKNPANLSLFLNVLERNPQDVGDTIVDILAEFPKRTLYQALQRQMNTVNEASLPYQIKLFGYAGAQLDELKVYFKHPAPHIQEASLLAIGFTGNPKGIPLLLPFVMSRQNSLARCAAAQSLAHLIQIQGIELPKSKNVFDALFVMLNTARNDEELAAVAHALGTFCQFRFEEITEVNIAVFRGRILDLIPTVSNDTKVKLLRALHAVVDMSSFEMIRELRKLTSREVQEMVASLFGRFSRDLRVIADIADMISHAEYSFRRYWITTAGKLRAIELTDMLVPLLANQDFRVEAFQALVCMEAEVLPYLAKWLHHEDPRIQKMTALVLSRISQDRIDVFCQIPGNVSK